MPVPPLATGPARQPRQLRIDPGKIRVFVCDDDLDFAAEMASALATSGFEARTLKDGRTPVEIFELFAPDIVLLDIFMPPPDGYEIINHIVQNKGGHAVSVVVLSGADTKTLEIASRFCTDRGIRPAAVLQKPVRLNDILSVCSGHRRQDRLTA
jgi:DNA-binding response OmpR family regulator